MSLQDESQIDEVINKLSALLTGGIETVRTDKDFKEQIRLLQKKQKNLHLMCVKEQAKVDQIQQDIADIQASKNRNKGKNGRKKNQKESQNNLDLNALEEVIAQLREESENLDIEGKEITQQVIDSQEQLADAKQELNAKYDNLIHFEEEFDSCGKQLALLKAQCDEKISHWESIRQATKHTEKEKIDLEIQRNQAALQVQNLKENQEKIELQIQLYEQLTARLQDQIQQNQTQVAELSAVNAQLEQKLANIADHPQQLRQVLQMSALMLNHKTQLLDSQIVKIKELQNGKQENHNNNNNQDNQDELQTSQKSINSDSSSLSEESNEVDKHSSQEENSSSRD